MKLRAAIIATPDRAQLILSIALVVTIFACMTACNQSPPKDRDSSRDRKVLPLPGLVDVADPVLEQQLKRIVNGPLTESALNNITELTLEGDIADLTGLEHCTELKSLVLRSALRDGSLGEDPSPSLTGLESIRDLDKLEELHISGFTIPNPGNWMPNNTKRLALLACALVDLSFLSHAPKLEELSLSLSSAPSLESIGSAPQLKVLRANLFINESENWTPLLDCTNLQELALDDTELTDENFPGGSNANWDSLKVISVRYNELTDVSFLLDCPSVASVYLDGNPLSETARKEQLKQLRDRGAKVYYYDP